MSNIKIVLIFNPIRPAFSVVCLAGGGGDRGPDAENQGYHQPIKMKLSMSYYSHKACPIENLSLVAFLFMEI